MLPIPFVDALFELPEDLGGRTRCIDKGFAVVGKRNRDHSVAREPAPNFAQHHAVRKRQRGWRCRVNDGRVSVRSTHRF
jgi:hypothetical protein